MSDKPKYLPSFVKRSRLKYTTKKELLSSNLEAFSLNSQNVDEYISSCTYKKAKLEIGFSNGSHFIKRAILEPATLFIGCEIYLNGTANVLKAIKQHSVKLCCLMATQEICQNILQYFYNNICVISRSLT
ncbi:MAG: hypothetical protein MTP17_04680 [Candidatus Midichloria sp.]|nr:MAG: hypothetical protein MTP17_04680 [Candidatus Midichloria sp.]